MSKNRQNKQPTNKKKYHSVVLGIMEMWSPNNSETSSDISKEWQKSTK